MKNLDDKIKNAFEQKESQLDKMDLWQAIEKELPEEKKDRKFIIWFLFGGFLMVLVFGLNYYFKSSSQRDITEIGIEKPTQIDGEDAQLTNENLVMTDYCPETQRTESELSDLKSKKPKEAFNLNPSNYKQSDWTSPVSPEWTSPNSFSSSKNTNAEKQVIRLESSEITIQDQPSSRPASTAIPPLSKKLPFIKVLPPPLVNKKTVDTNAAPVMLAIPVRAPKSEWSVKLYTDYQKLNRSFSGDNQDYAGQKSASEKIRYAFNSGILVSYELRSGLSVGIGFDYRVQEEVINWSGVVEENAIPFQSDSAFFFNYFQKTFYLAGTNNLIETSTRRLRNYNRIQQWSIPVELNYTAIQDSRLKLIFTGGAKFNFSNKMTGKYLGISGEILEQEQIYDLYKKSNVHTWYAGLGLEYMLSPQLSLTSDCRYQSSANIFRDELAVNLRYRGYSVGLGLRYRW